LPAGRRRLEHHQYRPLKRDRCHHHLVASAQIILQRTAGNAGSRPLLDVQQPAERIRELLKFRKLFTIKPPI